MLKRSKPITPGQRHRVRIKRDTEGGAKWRPLSLRKGKRQESGRNNRGRITVRHRGGGKKRLLRTRRNNGISKQLGEKERRKREVRGIQYDPNRTGRLALVSGRYKDSSKSRNPTNNGKEKTNEKVRYGYRLAAEGLKVGQKVRGGETDSYGKKREDLLPLRKDVNGSPIYGREGSTRKLKRIPVGSKVFNIESKPGKGGKYVRAAGGQGRLLRKPDGKAWVRLPSGKRREVSEECKATVGSVGGEEHRIEVMGKAGRMRNKGWRPTVRGEAMNPIDHPHGGRTRGGRPERTPWGRRAKGKPTRKKKNQNRISRMSKSSGEKWVVTPSNIGERGKNRNPLVE